LPACESLRERSKIRTVNIPTCGSKSAIAGKGNQTDKDDPECVSKTSFLVTKA
jgi:hypothetical protein